MKWKRSDVYTIRYEDETALALIMKYGIDKIAVIIRGNREQLQLLLLNAHTYIEQVANCNTPTELPRIIQQMTDWYLHHK